MHGSEAGSRMKVEGIGSSSSGLVIQALPNLRDALTRLESGTRAQGQPSVASFFIFHFDEVRPDVRDHAVAPFSRL